MWGTSLEKKKTWTTQRGENLLLVLILAATVFSIIGFVDVCAIVLKEIRSWL